MGTSEVAVAEIQPEERFEAEVVPQLDALLSFALRFTHARADAEDLVSETILRALDHRQQYRIGTNMRAWLFTILYRLFVSRRRAQRREVRLREDEPDSSPNLWVGDVDPEGRFYGSLIDETITRAIDDLPGPFRTAVVLSDMKGLEYREIAMLLGVPSGTVKSRIFRGRHRLRTTLAGYAAEMGHPGTRRGIAPGTHGS
jgi:RNA polymerase sigma-70 factor (ECF subfamily)